MTFEASLVRVFGAGERPVGCGFLAGSDGTVVTCAHVVVAAGSNRGGRLKLRWHLDPGGQQFEGTVLHEGWSERDRDDTAIIKIDSVPHGVVPLPVSDEVAEEAFQAVGYPSLGELDELIASGQVEGKVRKGGADRVQLSSRQVTSGFSGTPVWSTKRQVVVGIVRQVATIDENGRNGLTSFATPSRAFLAFCDSKEDLEPLLPEAPYSASWYVPRHREVKAALVNLKQSTPAVIYGPNGFGKSWLFSHLIQVIGNDAVGWISGRPRVVHLDLRPYMDRSVREFYSALIGTIQPVAHQVLSRTASFEQKLNDALESALTQGPLVLALENADAIVSQPYAPGFFADLRAKMENTGRWRGFGLLAAVSTIPELLNRRVHPSPFTLSRAISLGAFDDQQISELVHLYRVRCAEDAVTWLATRVGGHPLWTRAYLYHCFRQAMRQEEVEKAVRPGWRLQLASTIQDFRASKSLVSAVKEFKRSNGYISDIVHQDVLAKTGYFVEDPTAGANRYRLRGSLFQEFYDQLLIGQQ